jgi:6-pyruvoyltetrahydropterin/6-carboxytetrahydropterin synthase
MRIGRTYQFEAAHWLPTVAEDHKCRRLHGHQYTVEVMVEGAMREDGMVLDFAEIDGWMMPVIADLDHTTLNNIVALDIPTAEVLSRYILGRLPKVVASVKVWENNRSWAESTR